MFGVSVFWFREECSSAGCTKCRTPAKGVM